MPRAKRFNTDISAIIIVSVVSISTSIIAIVDVLSENHCRRRYSHNTNIIVIAFSLSTSIIISTRSIIIITIRLNRRKHDRYCR